MHKDTEPRRMNLHGHARGPLEKKSQDGNVRYYGGHYPLTVIDLPSTKGYKNDHLTLNWFSNFEFGKEGDPDTVKLVKGHHEGHVLFSFMDIQEVDGYYRIPLISPDGRVGNLETSDKRFIAPFLASIFHPNEEYLEFAGDTRLDRSALNYISHRTGLGLSVKQSGILVSSKIA